MSDGMRLTTQGALLLAKAIAGEALEFTRGAFGDGKVNGSFQNPTYSEQASRDRLFNERLSLPIIDVTVVDGTAKVQLEVKNSTVTEEFQIAEIGLFAKDGTGEVLYAYSYPGTKGDFMPAGTSAVAKNFICELITLISNAPNVTASITGSASGEYVLPTASPNQKGGVKVGNGLSMNGETLNVTLTAGENYSLPTASKTQKGGVKVGNGLSMSGETLNVTLTAGETYTLPTASTSTKGGVKVGNGLSMNGETLNVTLTAGETYTLPTASKTQKGGVKVGVGLAMDGDTLYADLPSYVLPVATDNRPGGVIIGDGIEVDTLGTISRSNNFYGKNVTLRSATVNATHSDIDLSSATVHGNTVSLRGNTVTADFNNSVFDLSYSTIKSYRPYNDDSILLIDGQVKCTSRISLTGGVNAWGGTFSERVSMGSGASINAAGTNINLNSANIKEHYATVDSKQNSIRSENDNYDFVTSYFNIDDSSVITLSGEVKGEPFFTGKPSFTSATATNATINHATIDNAVGANATITNARVSRVLIIPSVASDVNGAIWYVTT